ncbi:hypothetical protein ABB37_02262 [Leptomonas pyrrhocoris]|uniref:Uncharacterized protein n=1 Tax=Leptomonas pyrrhocoris TaxID=157538 RepID=A0A0M9G7V1_LEPPY|nr:hypothetical protein ABB37_02262 [Leptomonas pyrrhocoris]KPA84206.1 hypothetical protein ABB37_02262 [Leptomonas pyrrhocoris]|eukprot:XP_015662645.1 hypothetical protein ABB37_02262 [Leptomonas pyrrhocoris]
MTLERLICLLRSFCRLRLHRRQVFYTLADSYVWDAPSFLLALRKLVFQCSNTSLAAAFCGAVENVVCEIASKDEQLLACWLICEALRSRADKLMELLHDCKLLKPHLCFLLSSLYLGRPDTAPDVANADAQKRSLSTSNAELLTGCGALESSGFRASPKALEHDPQTTVQHSAAKLSKDRLASKSMSFLLLQSRMTGKLLIFCSQMSKNRKHARACCVRQLDDCTNYIQLRKAVELSRVNIFFVQRFASDAVKDFLAQCSVFCVDRLGREGVDQSSRNLGWQVYENSSEWIFSVQANCKQGAAKCWIDSRHTRAGILLSVHVKVVDQNLPKTLDAVTKQCCSSDNTRSVNGKRVHCANDVVLAELLSTWKTTFLFQFHVALTLFLGKKKSRKNSHTRVSRIIDQQILENVLEALSIMCRCQI